MRRASSALLGMLVAALLLWGVIGVAPSSPAAAPRLPAPAPSSGPSSSTPPADVLERLAEIPELVDEQAPEYRRVQFGDGWLDVDGNGCDTRNDILIRDLVDVVVDDRCRVLSGTLNDPYTGVAIAFVRGPQSSQEVQIDHILPLAIAWRGGAWRWSSAAREAFANDPLELAAVSGTANAQKGAKSISQWTPPAAAFQCNYAAAYVDIAHRYQIALSSADKAAAATTLASCGDLASDTGGTNS
ncbi:MAG: HNH endonuclease family protein [Protaetiibacter sp.]